MKRTFAIILFLLYPFACGAQTPAFLDKLLTSPTITWGQASYLVLVGTNNISSEASPQQCFDRAKQLGWAVSDAPERNLNYSQYSFLLMKAFGLHGGMWYTLFPCPRYAFQDLRFKNVLPPQADPDESLTGAEAVRIFDRLSENQPLSQERHS